MSWQHFGLIGLILLHCRTVFCGKGCMVGFAAKVRTRTVCTHSEPPVFFRDGMSLWYFNLNYARMTSDINQVQSGVNLFLRLFPTFTVYRVRRDGDGIYN
ncbi:MAG: hypothetical protein ACLTSZ_10450 [Lachnospiraceae bacterium]